MQYLACVYFKMHNFIYYNKIKHFNMKAFFGSYKKQNAANLGN